MDVRNVKKVIKGYQTVDGAGVQLVRVLGHADVKDIDPFLMLDAFDSQDPNEYVLGFPMHPHRGIETLTYLIDGKIDHRDTLGNSGRIQGGEAQWMTSGSGILHEEMPAISDRLFGLQLWINLPREHKMTEPAYHDINTEDMPRVEKNGVTVRVVAGNYGDSTGAKGNFVQPLILDISLIPGAKFSIPIPDSHTLFTYVLEGDGFFGNDDSMIPRRTAVIFGNGGTFQVKAGTQDLRFMLFSGIPLDEPVAWAGPIVMNTRQELEKAFSELDEGIFIKKR